MTTKTITEAQLASALVLPLSMTPEPWVRVMGLGTSTDPEAVLWNTHGEGFTVEQRAETVAHAAFAALPDHDCLMPSACGVTGFWCANAKPDNGLDVERLARAAATALDRWFGPPADGMSAATRRAIVDEMVAAYARLTSSPTAEES